MIAKPYSQLPAFALWCLIVAIEMSCFSSHQHEHGDDASGNADGACLLNADNGCENGSEAGIGRTDASNSADDTSVVANCPEGSWHDTEHHLCWFQDPPFILPEEIYNYCDNLSLGGLKWRVPTIVELRSLITGCPFTELSGPCDYTLTNNYCVGCQWYRGPAENGCYLNDEIDGSCSSHCSSSLIPTESITSDDLYRLLGTDPFENWAVSFNTGRLHMISVGEHCYTRCVRDEL